METVRTVADLRARVLAWRAEVQTVALTPTMGAGIPGNDAIYGSMCISSGASSANSAMKLRTCLASFSGNAKLPLITSRCIGWS